MSKIAVVTDTNSSMTMEECKSIGVYLLPMPFIVDGVTYFEGVDCTYEHFFEMLNSGSDVSTSQPSPDSVLSLWDEALKTHDYVIHIPMSSALSSSCETAKGLAMEYEGKVLVVDNKRISISQRRSVYDALAMIEKGLSAEEIAARLEEQSMNASIYLAVNRLDLLKKSGRVTAAGAALATVLNIKPVLQIQGGKLDAYSKERGMKRAIQTLLNAATEDMKNRFAGKNYVVDLAYSGDIAPALEWQKKCIETFGVEAELYRLPLSICCHVADGVIAVGCVEVE